MAYGQVGLTLNYRPSAGREVIDRVRNTHTENYRFRVLFPVALAPAGVEYSRFDGS